MKSHKLAVVIPAYNEGTVLGEVLRGAMERTKLAARDFVVVNDCSSDDTAAVAAAAGATVVNSLLNTGAGGATTIGLEYAKEHGYSYVVTMDADGQHDPGDVQTIIDTIQAGKYDLVIGSRLLNSQGMPWYRILGNKGLTFITKVMFGIGVTDSQSGLKGFSPRALAKIKVRTSGMEFCSEILWRAKQNKLSIHEVPAQAIYTEYSMAKGQSNWNALNIIKNLIKRKLLELINA